LVGLGCVVGVGVGLGGWLVLCVRCSAEFRLKGWEG
jgi:hypothetical protein